MSRSQPSMQNPAKRFFSWGGKNGTLSYWDKERGEKGENVAVAMPFPFMVLDELATMGGFCKPDDSGYWSNEVRSTQKQPLTVRTKQGVKETGLYQDLAVRNKGAKYSKSVYIAYYEGDGDAKQLVIGNVKFIGAGLSAWIEFGKKYKTSAGCVIIAGKSDEKTNGDTKYFEPVFKYKSDISAESESAACALDAELQAYLKTYFAAQGQEQTTEDYIEQRNKELEDYAPEKANAAAVGGNEFGSEYGGHVQTPDSDDIPFALIFAFIGLSFYLSMFGQIAA